jgi:hypothetical protein
MLYVTREDAPAITDFPCPPEQLDVLRALDLVKSIMDEEGGLRFVLTPAGWDALGLGAPGGGYR